MYTIYIYTHIHICMRGLRRYGHSGRYILSTMYIIMLAEFPPLPTNTPFPRGAYLYGTRTVINLWLYRVEINEPQYVITYVRNEHGVEIRFCGVRVPPGSLVLHASHIVAVWSNNSYSAGFVTVCNRFVRPKTKTTGYPPYTSIYLHPRRTTRAWSAIRSRRITRTVYISI